MIFQRFKKYFITALLISFSQLSIASDLLRVDEAFKLSTPTVENNQIKLNWQIADGYYLYKKRVKVGSNDITLTDIEFSKSKLKDDPIFGKTAVFFNQLDVIQSFTGSATQATIKVKYQGCEETKGVCYPPQTRTFTLDIPPTTQINQPTLGLKSLNNLLSLSSGNTLLSASDAFKLTATANGKGELLLDFKVAQDYHLYRDKIKVKLLNGSANIGQLILPPSVKSNDAVFGEVDVYKQDFQAQLPITDIVGTVKIEIEHQGCSSTSGVCYPPEKKVVEINASSFGVYTGKSTPNIAEDLSESDQITETLKNSSIWIVIGTFFLFGLLLSLTPCVFPMIPILSSIIVGQGEKITTRKSFTMSLVYVLAMSVTYTVAGVLAGIFGENLQVMFQNPWIIGSFVLIFIALSFSMFGFYELQLPNKLQSKLTNVSNNQKSGSYIGVAIMGFLSALIVGPCVAPPLAGALIYIGQTGDAFLGGAALFAMSIGMGVPLLLLGLSAGKLLPRAGAWMDNIKAIFGVMLLAIALWMAERILPAPIILALWSALLIGSAVYLGAFNSTDGKTGWTKLGKSIGIILFIYGIVIVIGMSAGSKDLLQPLKVLQGGGSSNAMVNTEKLPFQKIKSIDDVNKSVAENKLVMLDFYADWCISCKEMEKFTFIDPSVHQNLANVTLLKSDVTDNDDIDKALMKKLGIVGPPAILFFKNGQEIKSQRVVGFKNVEEFNQHINNSFK